MKLAEVCEISVHPDFVPNYGEGASMRVGHDAEAGLCVILPLYIAVNAARAESIRLHVSERFLRDKNGDPLGRPIPNYSHSAVGTPPNHPDLKPVIAQ